MVRASHVGTARWLVLAGALAAPTFIGGSCGGDPPGDGYLLVQVVTPDLTGTPLAGIGAVEVHSPRVDVVHRSTCNNPGTEKVLTVSSTPATFILNAGRPNVPALIGGQVPVPPGCIMQIRLITDSMSVTLNNTPSDAKVPSGPQTGIKVVPLDETKPFTVVKDKTTLVRVTYDPNESLVINKGQGIIEKPVLRGTQMDPDMAIGVVLDEVVITFDPGTSQADIQNLVASAGDTIFRQYPHEFVVVKLPNTAVLRDRVNFYNGKAHVTVALPNTLLTYKGPNGFSGTPSDPRFMETPPKGFEATNLNAVHVPAAWMVTTGSTGPAPNDFISAVVDNGFDLLHGDLLNNIWINEAEIPPAIRPLIKDVDGDFHITFNDLNPPPRGRDAMSLNANPAICDKTKAGDPTVCDPLDVVDGKKTIGYGWQDGVPAMGDGNDKVDDIFGWDFTEDDNLPQPDTTQTDPNHGTAVAGIMAGVGNNAVASAGVAWRTRLMLVKGRGMLMPNTNVVTRDSLIQGLVYAHTSGARVINMSVGGSTYRNNVTPPQNCTPELIVPVDKFKSGIQGLASEWGPVGKLTDKAVLIVAMADCNEDEDADGIFYWPGGFVRARPDIGVSYADATMITVTSVDAVSTLSMQPNASPTLPRSFNGAGRGLQGSVLIAAPGSFWRVNSAQPYPPAALNDGTTDCAPLSSRCSGTSFAAPMVAGAAILTLANNTNLNSAALKARLLTTADPDTLLNGEVEGSRLLNIQNAVGP